MGPRDQIMKSCKETSDSFWTLRWWNENGWFCFLCFFLQDLTATSLAGLWRTTGGIFGLQSSGRIIFSASSVGMRWGKDPESKSAQVREHLLAEWPVTCPKEHTDSMRYPDLGRCVCVFERETERRGYTGHLGLINHITNLGKGGERQISERQSLILSNRNYRSHYLSFGLFNLQQVTKTITNLCCPASSENIINRKSNQDILNKLPRHWSRFCAEQHYLQ